MATVSGLDTRKKYTPDEVVAMANNGKLRDVTLQGWFFRFDALTGKCEMVHFTDPTANRLSPGSSGGRRLRSYSVPDPTFDMREAVDRERPIVKRTPQERLASMTVKLAGGETGQDAAAKMMLRMLWGAGDGLDALSDEKVKEITGASWKAGDPIDADIVRRVAASYLGAAERAAAEQAREQNTKAGRKARKEQERLEEAEAKKWKLERAKREVNHENAKTQF